MIKEFFVPGLVIVLAIAFLDPFMYLMPSMMVNLLLALLMVVSVIYAVFIFKEKALDEREVAIRAKADRLAAMAGTAVLSAGIVYQVVFIHSVSPEIVLALVVIIITKSWVHYIANPTD